VKKIIFFGLVSVLIQAAHGFPVLICKTSGASGSGYKQLTLENRPTGSVLMTETYSGGGLVSQEILSSISTPISTKLVIVDEKTYKISVVFYKNQAVVLYEDGPESAPNTLGATVEFMTCQ
jgi:hypothetical protein